jgi:hypothetical protein
MEREASLSGFAFYAKPKERTMAVGWFRDGDVQQQIDASVADSVKLARSRLPEGESLKHCEICGEPIAPVIPGISPKST